MKLLAKGEQTDLKTEAYSARGHLAALCATRRRPTRRPVADGLAGGETLIRRRAVKTPRKILAGSGNHASVAARNQAPRAGFDEVRRK
ncbi:hypothetical protein [Oceanicella actignis]|uniref:hypothetical protein n=1 Tax=Oceanicella actignis TaxID=1189325 RepID=UPI000F740647|nr:hypothetical protein [Oceanicella actignis]